MREEHVARLADHLDDAHVESIDIRATAHESLHAIVCVIFGAQ